MDNYFDISGHFAMSLHINGTLLGYGYLDGKAFSDALCEKGKVQNTSLCIITHILHA